MFPSKSLLSAVLVALVAGRVSAAPILGLGDLWDGIKENFKPTTVSAFNAKLLPDLKYYAQYSAAAYCDPLNKAGVEVQCPDGICPDVTNSTSTTIGTFADTERTDTTGFIAKDDTKKAIVLSFRGSSSIRNFVADANIAMEDVPYCSGCSVHKGFLKSFEEALPLIDMPLRSLIKANPTYRVVMTGHSLGGAIATLAALHYRSQGIRITLYTYGAPRVGDVTVSNFISLQGTNYRVSNKEDPVPRVPPTNIGFGTITPEYHIKQGNLNVKATDFEVLHNPSSDISITNFLNDVKDHDNYLTPTKLSLCAGDEFEF